MNGSNNSQRDSSSSYGQILKSSSIVGSAQVINMAIGLVRTKLVAMLIGPSGVGLIGVYQSITSLTTTIAGLGIQTSGVREVVKHHGSGDQYAVANTIKTLRRLSWFTGIVGMLILIGLAPLISVLSFGNRDQALPIAALGLTILFGNISGGQSAIIQGSRRITDLARISVWGAIAGTLVSVVFYLTLGMDGIVPAVVAMSAISLGFSSFYARRIPLRAVNIRWSESIKQAKSLIRLGLALVTAGVLSGVVAYWIRILITQKYGLTGVGIYSAAFSLSGMFVQFVLGAMSADFYPRLTADASDNIRMTQLINEQTEIGLLLAFPGLIATLAFAPLLIFITYSSEFATAADLLKWLIAGCMARVLSWPLGFSILAKGQSRLFMLTEASFNALHLAFVWIGLQYIGLTGVSVAFAVLNVMHTLAMFVVNKTTISFTWSKNVKMQLAWMIPLILLSLLVSQFAPTIYSTAIGAVVSAISAVVCLRQLIFRIEGKHVILRTIRKLPGGKWLIPDVSVQ